MKKMTLVIVSIAALFAFTAGILVEQTQPLIRLHILANSNSSQDQMIKYGVRDRIINTMSDKFREAESLEESRKILISNLGQMEGEAQKVLHEYGSNDNVKAYYGMFDFPTKYYGFFSLPAGRYEAVRLVIGEGKGANWWCVLFPPLCFVDGKTSQKVSGSIANQKEVKLTPKLAAVKIWNKVLARIAADIKL